MSKYMNVMFMFIHPVLIIVYVRLFWVAVCVKDVFSIFCFEMVYSHPSEGAGRNSHTHTPTHTVHENRT